MVTVERSPGGQHQSQPPLTHRRHPDLITSGISGQSGTTRPSPTQHATSKSDARRDAIAGGHHFDCGALTVRGGRNGGPLAPGTGWPHTGRVCGAAQRKMYFYGQAYPMLHLPVQWLPRTNLQSLPWTIFQVCGDKQLFCSIHAQYLTTPRKTHPRQSITSSAETPCKCT